MPNLLIPQKTKIHYRDTLMEYLSLSPKNLKYFPDGKMLFDIIIADGELFTYLIIYDGILITLMTTVKQTTVSDSIKENQV